MNMRNGWISYGFVLAALFASSAAKAEDGAQCEGNTPINSREELYTFRARCEAAVTTFGAGDRKAEDETKKANAAKAGNFADFIDSNFGWGVGAAHGLGASRVDSASVVNGIVRVDQTSTNRPIIALEAHHFFFPKGWKPEDRGRVFAHGPFASIQASSDNSGAVSFGLGYMVGWSDEIASTPAATKSWNLGLGVLLESNVQRLGDGIHENQPLPDGETQVRYRKSGASSLFILLSRAF